MLLRAPRQVLRYPLPPPLRAATEGAVTLMPDSAGMANEVVMLRGHNVDYSAPITSAIHRLGEARGGGWLK